MQLVVNGETINYTFTLKTDRHGRSHRYYRAFPVISTDPITGHVETKEITAPDEKKFREKINGLQHQRPLEAGAVLPFKIYLDKWLHRNSLRLKRSTLEHYRYTIDHYLTDRIGDMITSEITEDDMIDFYYLIKDLFGDNVAADIYTMLQKPWRDAVKNHIIYENPQENIRIPKPQRDPIIPLTLAESKDLMQLTKQDAVYGNPIAASLRIGLRISECVGFPIDAYNPTNKTVVIRRQILYSKRTGYYLQNSTKNGTPRVLTLDDNTALIFDNQLKKIQAYKEAAGSNWHNTYNCLFVNKNGHFLTHNSLRNHLKEMCEQIGRTDFKFHHLRHTCATNLLETTGNIRLVQSVLGHKRLDSTGIYLSTSPDKIKTALESVSNSIYL